MDQKGFKTRIGGQAVIEGIAMKGSDKTCLAVRLPDGSIHTELFDTPRPKGMNIPILRGPIAMIHSLIDGMKYINLSAAYAFPEDENKDTKEGKAAPADGAPVPERAEPAPEADGNTPAEQPAEKKPAKSDTALTVISGLLGLALAVLNGDEKALTTAPGIGKRIAQRILLELKDKMAKESASVDFSDLTPAVPASDAASAARSDAIAGLTVLGYSMPEINAALRKLPSIEGMSADQIIKAALRAMMQQ